MPRESNLRDLAQDFFQIALNRANPAQALRLALESSPPSRLGQGRRILIAMGKAAIGMMSEAQRQFPDADAALVVTNPENARPLPGAVVLAGAHPVPDQSSVAAGDAIKALLANTSSQDQIIVMVSGGASALVAAPRSPVSIQDKTALTQQMLGAGLAIEEMNMVRQQLSDLKGGGLLRLAAPAGVHAYILSDVIGNDLRAVASGPTTAPLGTAQQAIHILRQAGLWANLPDRIKTALRTPAHDVAIPEAHNHLIGSNAQSLSALHLAINQTGQWKSEIINDQLTGDVAEAADQIVRAARRTNPQLPSVLIFGGETTVQLQGNGRGGRNQELALRVAMGATGILPRDWVFLSGGTDGRDGPTEAAGGLVDGATLERISQKGGQPNDLLANNDSFHALQLAGDLLITGATGTNVADIQLMLLPATAP